MQADALDDSSEQAARLIQLQQFIRWLLPVAFGFALFHLVAYVVLQDLGNAMGGVAVLAYGCAVLWAARFARRGAVVRAVTILCAGLLVMVPVHVLALPDLYPALAVAPLLAFAIALPYLPTATLRPLALACMIVAMVGAPRAPQA